MTNQTTRIVFISYSHVDKDFVNLFAGWLINFDIQIWKDSKDIPVGTEILDNVYEAMKNTSHFCCIISSSSVKSPWVKEELSYAKHRRLEGTNLAIVPILIDAVEIPDYLKVYRCAHLEDRRLSLENPEFVMVLRAFGVDLQSAPPIIADLKRKRLLKRCVDLRSIMVTFGKRLGTFQNTYAAYQNAKSVSKHIRVRDSRPRRRGPGYRFVLNPAYFQIATERQRATSAIIDLREIACCVPDSINLVKRAVKAAGLTVSDGGDERLRSNDTWLWVSLYDALDQAATVSKVISTVHGTEGDSDDEGDEEGEPHREDGWDSLNGLYWTGEKLPRLITSISGIEAVLERVIGTLVDWERFDSDQ